jgi:uncharacterized repeat protein (TIGR03803 family)
LYGTTATGGNGGGGIVFELSPSGNGWVENVLYDFNGFPGSTDGNTPLAEVIFDASGNLYGTTAFGGTSGFGAVFELTPGAGGWTEAILYNFASGNDGAYPEAGLVFDLLGNLYGTTFAGGGSKGCLGNGCGTVFRLTPAQGGQWTESLFSFPLPGSLGFQPAAPVVLDSAGRVYGTTTLGGSFGDGVTFRITQ